MDINYETTGIHNKQILFDWGSLERSNIILISFTWNGTFDRMAILYCPVRSMELIEICIQFQRSFPVSVSQRFNVYIISQVCCVKVFHPLFLNFDSVDSLLFAALRKLFYFLIA